MGSLCQALDFNHPLSESKPTELSLHCALICPYFLGAAQDYDPFNTTTAESATEWSLCTPHQSHTKLNTGYECTIRYQQPQNDNSELSFFAYICGSRKKSATLAFPKGAISPRMVRWLRSPSFSSFLIFHASNESNPGAEYKLKFNMISNHILGRNMLWSQEKKLTHTMTVNEVNMIARAFLYWQPSLLILL